MYDSNSRKFNYNSENYGGAIHTTQNYDSLVVRNTKFRYNKVYNPEGSTNGGSAWGGAIYTSNVRGHFLVSNSVFIGNEALGSYTSAEGGGWDSHGNAGAISVRVQSYWNGIAYSYPYKSVFINNTFVNNKAEGSGTYEGQGAVLTYNGQQSTVLINNNFWGNTVNNNMDTTNWEIIDLFNNSSHLIMAAHNNFQYAAATANSYGDNNMSRDPRFVLGSGDDQYKLSDASRLIGAGAKTYGSYTAPAHDLLGATRPSGASTDNPDIGAYENALAVSPYPDKVAGLTATAANQSAVLAWTANSETDIAKYAVYKSTTSGFTPASSDSVGATASGSIVTYTVTGLTNGTPYYFKVKAINTSNQAGEYSNQRTATPVYQGPDWYVAVAASGGSASNEGSSNSPMLNLTDAVTAASTGHTIHIAAGTYTFTSASEGNNTFDGSKTLVIKGAGAATTIIDANQKHRHFYFSANSNGTLLVTTF